MTGLVWSEALENKLEPMDATHREFVTCYNAVVEAAPEQLLAAFDALIAHTEEHFALENGWMEAVDFPGCHRAEHDRVLAVMYDIRKRVAGGDTFFFRRLVEELPAWFRNHVDGMDAALAFHLQSVGFDFEAGVLPALAEGEQRGEGCACASLSAESACQPETARSPACSG